ncbi:phage head morphogenesis protein [Bacillus paranthracis]|nr:phage head morphogenesis protein [Bacillus paranthracis]
MNTEEYWSKRAEVQEAKGYIEAEKLEKRMRRSFERAEREVTAEMRAYLSRKGFDFAELVKALTKKERHGRRVSLVEFLNELQESDQIISDHIAEDVKIHLDKRKLSRLDAIQSEMLIKLGKKALTEEKSMCDLFISTFKDTLISNKYDFYRHGIQSKVYELNDKLLKSVLSYPWSGNQFSSRLWENKRMLLFHLRGELTQGVLQGLHADEIAVRFAEKMKAPLRNAITMIYTEQAYFYGKATLDSYQEADIDRYKLHVTFDARTSARCKSLDPSKIYKTADASPGSNYPPLHARCRTLAIPYFEGIRYANERMVRDKNDKSIKTSGVEMTYQQYEKLFQPK